MIPQIIIKGRRISRNDPVFIIAEVSANHKQNFDHAVALIKKAKEIGADAVKFQAYTPDTMTIQCDHPYFLHPSSSLWANRSLYDLYVEAYTPWDWLPKLKKVADDIGIIFFVTAFDISSVDFLEKMKVVAYKIASYELVDLPLIKKVAKTNKPVIISTGMGSLKEIDEAVTTVLSNGSSQIALLKCTTSYPALPKDMNLKTISHLSDAFAVPTGLSDHTKDSVASLVSIALGASIIEKHITLSHDLKGLDDAFSLDVNEFKSMVNDIRIAEKAVGNISFTLSKKEKDNLQFRRSLFAVKDIKRNEKFTDKNIKSIRPAFGMHTRYYEQVLKSRAKTNIKKGTPLQWNLINT